MEVWLVVPTVTDQFVPVGNPDSEKMREYWPGGKAVNVMTLLTATPLTENAPDVGRLCTQTLLRH